MKRFIYLMLGLFSMFSCIDDQSDVGGNAISRLTFVTELEKTYQQEKFSEFILEAPEVKQENKDKELFYEWQVNYEVKSTAKELKYECLKSGVLPCRLKVYNEDGAIFHEFKLDVSFPYGEGLILLSKVDDRSMLSFKDLIAPDKAFVKNVYAQNNPDVPLGKEPVDIAYINTDYYKYIYIATENPLKVVKLDYNTMETLNVLKFPESHIERIIRRGDYNMTFIGNGKIMDMSCGGEDFTNYFQQTITGPTGGYPNAVLADQCLLFQNSYDVEAYMVFDTHDGILLKGKGSSTPAVQVYDTITGARLLGMAPCRKSQEGLVLVKDKNGKNHVAYFNFTVAQLKSYWPAPAELTEESVFITSGVEDILYYSIGNQIYRYNYLSDGNFPTKSDFTVGEEGDVIKDMILDRENKKLYVAVDSPSGEYKGSVYCYDNETKSLLWDETGVAGEIIRMLYKEKSK